MRVDIDVIYLRKIALNNICLLTVVIFSFYSSHCTLLLKLHICLLVLLISSFFSIFYQINLLYLIGLSCYLSPQSTSILNLLVPYHGGGRINAWYSNTLMVYL